MNVALAVLTDGRRECIERAIPSALENLQGVDLEPRVIFDDSGDNDYHRWLVDRFTPLGFDVLSNVHRLGFAGATARGRRWLADLGVEWAFSTEDDFTYDRPVPVDEMREVLHFRPDLAQMALRRQPVVAAEFKAGGIIELDPHAYEDRTDGVSYWLAHAKNYTTNPHLVSAEVLAIPWPDVTDCETAYSATLLEGGFRFAYWGARESGSWVTHIGHQRHAEATGY